MPICCLIKEADNEYMLYFVVFHPIIYFDNKLNLQFKEIIE